ncbi:hypothetical protein OSB04_006659 [Centaurea solstitialis]|uniref:Uncharacterized protein n=1 Tax=Centaurea solstitialis TaxID=347529 RepID=A0AA38WS50_9ASTR|nr:hypothetical protein OSB04_006659 [Centaurea solstitialis]
MVQNKKSLSQVWCDIDESQSLLRTPRKDNVYCLDLERIPSNQPLKCLFSKASHDESNLWHRRMCHMNFKNMNKLVKHNLVRGLPRKEFTCNDNCVACLKGKQHKSSHKSKEVNSISSPLQLIHMDLFGPTNVMSLGKKSYCLVIVDDFSRYTWFYFLKSKDETSGLIKSFVTRVEKAGKSEGKFESRSEEGFLVSYATQCKGYRVFNSLSRIIEESDNVKCNEHTSNAQGPSTEQVKEVQPQFVMFPIPTIDPVEFCTKNDEDKSDKTSSVVDQILDQIIEPHSQPESPQSSKSTHEQTETNLGDSLQEEAGYQTRTQKNHPSTLVTGDMDSPMLTRHRSKQVGVSDPHSSLISCILSQEEPKKAHNALKDPSWIEAMQEELLQFVLQHVWDLVDLPNGHRAIGTKWIFRNKKDERGIVIKNKARLVAQGYTQEEGIDYDVVFAPVARIKAIRLFLVYASFKNFKVYQMDVKSAFLYGKIEEEVYVCQQPGFEDPRHPDRVYKLNKALYGLHQAPRAWYDTLSSYLLENDFIRDLMHKKFKMSAMGELNFFLGLQVAQKEDGIFIHQSKYVMDILTKFGLTDVKPASTAMETHKHLTVDTEGKEVDVHHYISMIGSLMYLTASRPDIMFVVYSDYGGANMDRKSTTGGCPFLGSRLVSWQCNKQTSVSTSTAEAEYIAAASCSHSAISIVNNPVKHSKTKHIEIRFHFIRDCNEKKLIQHRKYCLSVTLLLRTNSAVITRKDTAASNQEHNKVAYLKKDKNNADFHEIIDFLKPSHIAIAITIDPPIYRAHMQQFWENATTVDTNDVPTISSIKVPSKEQEGHVDGKAQPTVQAQGAGQDWLNITKTFSPATQGEQSSRGPRCQETMGVVGASARQRTTTNTFNDPSKAGLTPEHGEDRYTNDEVMNAMGKLAVDCSEALKLAKSQASMIADLQKVVKAQQKLM